MSEPTYRVMFYVDIPKADVICADEAFFHGLNHLELEMRSGRIGEETLQYQVLDLETGQPATLDSACSPDTDTCPTRAEDES